MTSSTSYNEIYVWIWLPEETEPIVAGKLTKADKRVLFTYGQSYLERPNAIPIYDKELPLKSGVQEKNFGTEPMPGCIRDAAPDAWGRRVILNKLLGAKGKTADPGDLDEFTYLMESGSDRIGGLDFQKSPKTYEPRLAGQASLNDLLQSAEQIEKGMSLNPDLALAIQHGTPIGGARPKALINDERSKYIAKFSSSTDQYNVIKSEFIAMRMAKLCGLNVANVKLARASKKDVLLIERFDRQYSDNGWTRRLMISALTLLGLDEMTPHYASYEDLAEIIRHRFTNPKQTLEEMFGRLVFNILSGNTDDHARNHAAFWDGKALTLTPAYDICPQMRQGGEASQAMMIARNDRSSRLITCLAAAKNFMLSEGQARNIIDQLIALINKNLDVVCKEADLSPIDQALFKERMFMNSYAFEGYRD
ncbi:MAG: phosphatidylinositol kinase [Alphaproteobacteria bacterium CG_4_9_14_3_um_filter_47_13]|nr:MAG: phosphatidylinositol kinase [Alphaproteobacteria bacterium CG_4_9_14_3_um_filter_47_13]